jgi:hypothetical protein
MNWDNASLEDEKPELVDAASRVALNPTGPSSERLQVTTKVE